MSLPLQTSPNAATIGEILSQRGILSPKQLEQALQTQQQHGGLLGKILYSLGFCNQLEIHQALAEQQQRPFINLEDTPPETSLLRRNAIHDYLHHSALPWHRGSDGKVIIATSQVTVALQQWATDTYGKDGYKLALTSPRDIRNVLNHVFQDYFTEQSCDNLWRKAPILSARSTLLQKQAPLLIFLLTAFLALAIAFPIATFLTALLIANTFCLGTLIFKAILFWKGVGCYYLDGEGSTMNTNALPDSELPLYTILVPMYDEAESLPHLIDNLRALDYPRHKLDIKLVLEADDARTLEAAKALQPEGCFEIITVPPSQPRTKPKACNYALRFARGEFVTIYDAEDKPEPQQLRKVVNAFRTGNEALVCIQCRLNYYNRQQNLLTALFAIEYAAWFNYMLVALDRYGLPIPLGGTSNHIYRHRLMELGEWDPYNVTEDADLGIRLTSHHYRTATLNSLTLEEAPVSLWSWIKQRSRWIKGHMQTWLVHMRRPFTLYRKLGSRGFWGFQFFIGGPCLVFLSTPFLIIASLYLLQASLSAYNELSLLALILSATVLVSSLVLHCAMALVVLAHERWKESVVAALVFPFYWILHSIASFRGLWQLFTRPHYWDKTTHGHTQNR